MTWKGRKPKSEFETGFGMFYHAALLAGVLSPKTESLFLEYYLAKPDGMFYIYDKPLNPPPKALQSREASRWLAAVEVLSRYGQGKEKLLFAADWLRANQSENGTWDFGEKAGMTSIFPCLTAGIKVPESSTVPTGPKSAPCAFSSGYSMISPPKRRFCPGCLYSVSFLFTI